MPWKAKADGDFPSLGWQVLEWCTEFLPSPRDRSAPLLFTNEQALQIVEWYRLDENGVRVYRRGYSRRSKGWGKSPVEAAKSIAEFRGPVRFDGWDATGEPVGRPWGTSNDPRAWVQIGAISEDQTDNTWSVIHYLLTENDGKAADALGIDAGLTRCFLRNTPGAKMEPVTSAAGSREGQPITYGVIDESHLMIPSNGGVRLASTIRRNVAKMGGTSYETTNAFIVGQKSVAESSWNAVRRGRGGIFADEIEAPREIGGVEVNEHAPDSVLLAALDAPYGDSWWVDKPRQVSEARDGSTRWADWARYFLNWNMADSAGWQIVSQQDWLDCAGAPAPAAKGRAAVSVGIGQQSASLSWAGKQDDGRLRVEVVRHEPIVSAEEPGWLTQACLNAQTETGMAILYDPKSPTAGVIPTLEAAGVQLEPFTELAQACSAWQNDVVTHQLLHLSHPSLTDAVRLAGVKRSGEAWVLSARASTVDISPFESVVIAAAGERTGVQKWTGAA